MEIKRRCGLHGCSLCGRGHDVKLCPSSILLLHGRQDWYPVTGLWYGEVINAFAAPPRKLPQYRWAGCRWQAELSARCPVCSDLSRFGSGEGRGGDGSEVIGGLSKDARGAIHEFIFPSLVRVIHLQSQRIDTLMRSNHVQTCVFVFFFKAGKSCCFLEEAPPPALILARSVRSVYHFFLDNSFRLISNGSIRIRQNYAQEH